MKWRRLGPGWYRCEVEDEQWEVFRARNGTWEVVHHDHGIVACGRTYREARERAEALMEEGNDDP